LAAPVYSRNNFCKKGELLDLRVSVDGCFIS